MLFPIFTLQSTSLLPKNKQIRIVQLIDSLEPGGAERMAVNYANAFLENGYFSGIISTRAEGTLLQSIATEVAYLYLQRTKIIDPKAWFKAAAFLRKHQVTHLQVHGTSLFFAVGLKLFIPTMQLIWHDHLGNRPETNKGKFSLQVLTLFAAKIVVVNEELEQWAKKVLWRKQIKTVTNFTSVATEVATTILKGPNAKRMVCLANLKHPKNHIFILNSFNESGIHELGWTLHLVGKDFDDAYSQELQQFVELNQLEERVFFYGSCADTASVLKQAAAGILGSTSEGFPVALLEYGSANLAVIATDVGYTSHLIKTDETGWLIPSNSKEKAINALKELAINPLKSSILARNLNIRIESAFSQEKAMQELIQFIQL